KGSEQMTTTIKAIETRYKMYRFRSRLEARWAVFFDAMGIEWDYEPEGYILPDGTYYLPDFFCRFSATYKAYSPYPNPGCFFEIKPIMPTREELKKARWLQEGTHHHTRFLIGEPGSCRVGYVDSNFNFCQWFSSEDSDDPEWNNLQLAMWQIESSPDKNM